MIRPRDNQRQKLYNAEKEAFGYQHPPLDPLPPFCELLGSGDLPTCQAWVDSLCRERWFQSRWGRVQITVHPKQSGRPSARYGGGVFLPKWSRMPWLILHEVAHVLCHSRYAGHGPEYAAIYLTLVEHHLGTAAARHLREMFRKHRVNYRAGLENVPKPGSKPVVTQKVVAERRKAREAVPVSSQEASSAAQIVRRAVKHGLLGGTGTKQRSYALAIARQLEGLTAPSG